MGNLESAVIEYIRASKQRAVDDAKKRQGPNRALRDRNSLVRLPNGIPAKPLGPEVYGQADRLAQLMTAEAFDLAAVEARALSEARNHYRRILEVRRPQQQGMADRDKEFCAACMALGVWRKTDAGYGLTHDQFEQLIDQRLQAAGLFCNIDAYHRVPTEKHDEEDDEDEEQDQEEEDAVLAEQVRQKIDKIMRDPLSFIEALAFHLKMGLALPAEFREPENQSITSLYVPGLHDVPAFEDIPPALPEPARPFLEVAPTAIVPAFPPLFAYADDQSAPRGKYEVFPAEDYLPMMDDVYGYDCGCGNSPADDTMHPLDTTARHDHFSPRTRLGQGLQNETTKATIPVEDHIQGEDALKHERAARLSCFLPVKRSFEPTKVHLELP